MYNYLYIQFFTFIKEQIHKDLVLDFHTYKLWKLIITK